MENKYPTSDDSQMSNFDKMMLQIVEDKRISVINETARMQSNNFSEYKCENCYCTGTVCESKYNQNGYDDNDDYYQDSYSEDCDDCCGKKCFCKNNCEEDCDDSFGSAYEAACAEFDNRELTPEEIQHEIDYEIHMDKLIAE